MTLSGSEIRSRFGQQLAASIEVHNAIDAILPAIVQAAMLLVEAYGQGRKALFFGNGGSASDAQHLAAELTGRFSCERRPLPALALHANTSAVTAIGNDYGYDHIFSRQLTAFAQPGDVAVALSTSGRSKNVLQALALRDQLGIRTIALTSHSHDPSPMAPWSDVVLAVPSRETPRIQEAHILIGHMLCDAIDQAALRAESKP